MRIDSKDFRVREGKEIKLKQWPTEVNPYYDSKKHFKKLLRAFLARVTASPI